jgi:hypothetical protein
MAEEWAPNQEINVMRQHKVFLQKTRSVPIMGLPKELDSPAIGEAQTSSSSSSR